MTAKGAAENPRGLVALVRDRPRIAMLAVFAVVTAWLVLFDDGLIDQAANRRREDSLNMRIAEFETGNARQREINRRIEMDDPEQIEEEARRQWMARPDERVMYVELVGDTTGRSGD